MKANYFFILLFLANIAQAELGTIIHPLNFFDLVDNHSEGKTDQKKKSYLDVETSVLDSLLFSDLSVQQYEFMFGMDLMSSTGNGNGGDVLLCHKNSAVGETIQLLDFYEATEFEGLNIEMGGDDLSTEEKLDLVFARVGKKSRALEQTLRKSYVHFKQNTRFAEGITLINVKDSAHDYLPQGCLVEQIAVQKSKDSKGPYDPRYIIRKDFWDLLSTDHKAGLILHELIYRELNEHPNSLSVRSLTALISSDSMDRLTPLGFSRFAGRHGLAVDFNVSEQWSVSASELDRFLNYQIDPIGQERFMLGQDVKDVSFDGQLKKEVLPGKSYLIFENGELIGIRAALKKAVLSSRFLSYLYATRYVVIGLDNKQIGVGLREYGHFYNFKGQVFSDVAEVIFYSTGQLRSLTGHGAQKFDDSINQVSGMSFISFYENGRIKEARSIRKMFGKAHLQIQGNPFVFKSRRTFSKGHKVMFYPSGQVQAIYGMFPSKTPFIEVLDQNSDRQVLYYYDDVESNSAGFKFSTDGKFLTEES